jgi:tripartite-type tricarboxylate transporter receptor subunit TctC
MISKGQMNGLSSSQKGPLDCQFGDTTPFDRDPLLRQNHKENNMQSIKRWIKHLGFAAMAITTMIAAAQSYPSRPVKLIVPYAAGQGTDILGRYIGDELSKALNQPFVIENRAGAGGNIGTAAAAKSPADGYTIMIGTNATHAANAFLFANPGFDAQADFVPIAMLGILPLVYVTLPTNPVSSMVELVAAARANPNTVNIAVSTTTCRMAHELFKDRGNAPMFPVDYQGSAQSVTAVLGGHIPYAVDTITSLRSNIEGGRLKPLGVTSASSTKLLPGVKSLAEQGIPGYELVGWTAIFAPKGVPSDAARILATAIKQALERKEVQDKLLQLGVEPVVRSQDELRVFVGSEKEKWGGLIRAAGLKPN